MMFFTRISVVEHWSYLNPERRERRRILEIGPMIPHVSKQTNFEMTAVESSRGQNGDKKHLIANTRSDELSIISIPNRAEVARL